jgi:hypothetical protein
MIKRIEHNDRNGESVVLWTPWGLQPSAKPDEHVMSAGTYRDEVRRRLAEERHFWRINSDQRLN